MRIRSLLCIVLLFLSLSSYSQEYFITEEQLNRIEQTETELVNVQNSLIEAQKSLKEAQKQLIEQEKLYTSLQRKYELTKGLSSILLGVTSGVVVGFVTYKLAK